MNSPNRPINLVGIEPYLYSCGYIPSEMFDYCDSADELNSTDKFDAKTTKYSSDHNSKLTTAFLFVIVLFTMVTGGIALGTVSDRLIDSSQSTLHTLRTPTANPHKINQS